MRKKAGSGDGALPLRGVRAGRLTAPLLAAIVAGLPLGCTSLPPGFPGAPPIEIDRTGPTSEPALPPRTVVLLTIDGLAPWVLEGTETPTLDALADGGAQAVWAETTLPSRTLPSHMSMLSGLDPEAHGVRWNRWAPTREITSPTLFSACREADLRCGLFAAKKKFAHFARSEPGVELYRYLEDDEAVFGHALRYLVRRRPHFVMLHVGRVDVEGHSHGWGSEAQRGQIRRIDAAARDFLAKARTLYPGRLTLIVTADHGGEGRFHGGDAERHVRIPWIAWGDGVAAGRRIDRVRTVDTAATIRALLSLPPASSGTSHFPFEPGPESSEPDTERDSRS